ncbi:MAG: MFS transporter [Acidobacteria bacterium]|nr:MFS transporter [Acidobacteriota bacterium]
MSVQPDDQLNPPNLDVSVPAPQPPLIPGVPARLFAPQVGMLRALRHRNYRLFWTGNFLSNIGTWMQYVAQGWLVLELTNSPFLLGLVGFTQFVPALVFSLPGGVIADRVNRRRLLLGTHSAMLLLTLTLAVSLTLGVISYTEILVVVFLLGTASAINAPSYQAMVQDTSSREDVLNAIALNSMQFNLSRFIGPTIAGILVSTVGLASCFYINSLSFLAPLVALSLLHYRPVVHATEGSAFQRLVAGFRYIWTHRYILILISLVAMVSLFGLPYLVFLPVFARDILGVGARGLGYMVSASGGGALLGALLLASWPAERRRGPLLLSGSMLFFAAVLVLALSQNFHLSLAALVVAGGAMVAGVATVNSLIQTLVSDAMRGRVLSMHTMAYLGFSPLGSLLVGTLANVWGTPRALAASAALPLVVVAAIALSVPTIRRLH